MYIHKFTASKNGNQYFMVFLMKIMQGSGLLIDNEVVKDKSVEELNAQLVSLVGENGGRDANKCFQKQVKYFRP